MENQKGSRESEQYMIVVRSPVRISFGGGGTDLPAYFEKHDGAVLSASINKYSYVVINERSDTHIQIISSDLRVFRHWNGIEEINQEANQSELVIPLSVLKQIGGVGG